MNLMVNNWLNSDQRIRDILLSIPDLNENGVLDLLYTFPSIQHISSNASIDDLQGRIPTLNKAQMISISKIFNTKQKQL